MTNPICPYCNKASTLVKGNIIYPRRTDLHDLNFYHCVHCNAYTGCHNKTTNPKGTLANHQLRQSRINAHKHFDDLWKNGYMSRSSAYKQLADYMQLSINDAHIGFFNIEQCNQVIKFVNDYWDNIPFDPID